MKRKDKLLATALVLGILGAIGGYGVFAAFSATTSNTANSITAGTVALSDNDAASSLYNQPNVKPTDPFERCIRVTYNGSLDADVKLYTPSTFPGTTESPNLASHVNLKITPGTQTAGTFPSCSNFTPAAGGNIYDGSLAAFASARNGWSNGLSAYPGTATKWATGDSLVYRFTLTVDDTNAAQGLSTGSHEFRWEARNQ